MSRVGDLLLEKQAEIDALKRELLAREDQMMRYGFAVLVVGVVLIALAFYAGAGCEATRAVMGG